MTRLPVITNRTEGRTIGVVGDLYRFLAIGTETDGKYAMWEATVPPGGGPPPHIHRREEEAFYILDGEVTFYLGEERIVARSGMFLNMPIGCLHSFRNESNYPATLLISIAPAGLEQMFFEVGQPVRYGETPPMPKPEEIDKLLAAAARYGVEIQTPAR